MTKDIIRKQSQTKHRVGDQLHTTTVVAVVSTLALVLYFEPVKGVIPSRSSLLGAVTGLTINNKFPDLCIYHHDWRGTARLANFFTILPREGNDPYLVCSFATYMTKVVSQMKPKTLNFQKRGRQKKVDPSAEADPTAGSQTAILDRITQPWTPQKRKAKYHGMESNAKQDIALQRKSEGSWRPAKSSEKNSQLKHPRPPVWKSIMICWGKEV